MNSQSRAIEDVLRREDIPYKIIGGLKFYERKEIKDAIAYLRLIANSSDNISFARIINEPKRGIGKTSLDNIQKIADENSISMYEVVKHAEQYMPKLVNSTKAFVDTIEELKGLVYQETDVSEIIKQTLKKTGYTDALKLENTIEAQSRIENLEELLTVAMEFEKESADKSLQEFLNGISLSSDTDNIEESDDMVTLMTLHSAKGLEYPAIFLVGLEEGIFPGNLSMGSEEDIQEERRLFYVGITRAKRYLYVTFAKKRTIFGSTSYNPPSRFVNEIPKELFNGYDDAIESSNSADKFADSQFEWTYGGKFNKFGSGSSKNNGPVITKRAVDSGDIPSSSPATFGKSVDSFLKNMNVGVSTAASAPTDLSQYKVGQAVFHKKFGEGVITGLDPEGDDYKVDIEFKNFGHKRLMLKFARLEIID
jgi:DNA helicase-2/ATP-dependent DNA helicase PcrA